MLVRDIMTRNVITITSDTYVLDAERIMDVNRIGRLPVVDNEKLVGIVTKKDVLKAGPVSTTPSNQRRLFYLISKMTVSEVMKRAVLTIAPDMTIEKSVAVAQRNKVGSLPVVEGDRVVGILTTNDIFYKVLNPLFGIGEKGQRIIIYGGGKHTDLGRILDFIEEAGLRVKVYWIPPDGETQDLILHLDLDDASSVIAKLSDMGYRADPREFAV